MSETYTTSPTENVRRGSLFALGAIVFALVVFSIVGAVSGYINGTFIAYLVGIAAIVVPSVTLWLYRKGSGGGFAAGKAPFIAITIVAILLGVLCGIIARAYVIFNAVGGDGGLLASAFWRTVGRQLGSADGLLALGIGIALGAVGLYRVLKAPPAAPPAPSPASPLPADVAAEPLPPVAPPASPSAPATPTAGVLLNDEPLDPDKKR
jgi:hypothetical protein